MSLSYLFDCRRENNAGRKGNAKGADLHKSEHLWLHLSQILCQNTSSSPYASFDGSKEKSNSLYRQLINKCFYGHTLINLHSYVFVNVGVITLIHNEASAMK